MTNGAAACLEAQKRLATYGTLAPGRVNAHELAALSGAWTRGTVRGRLVEEGWGAAHGCPAIVLDPQGEDVEVEVFTSDDLPAHWGRLDAFEGEGYQRTVVEVSTSEGTVKAYIYALRGAEAGA